LSFQSFHIGGYHKQTRFATSTQNGIEPAAAGDSDAAHARLDALKGIRELAVVEQVIEIGQELIMQAALPAKAKLDALHIAVAALHQMNFLLTWNCTHIANPIQRPMIESVIRGFGYTPPVICTPQELLEALNEDH